MVAPRALAAKVQLHSDLRAERLNLHADRRAIRQILLNLLSNAVKFSPGGSVAVTVADHPTGDLALIVSDTGIGMSENEIEIALSPFGQVANVHTRVHDGSGLGLPLVKSLAALHGAKFSIVSAPGVGTTVSLIFPAKRVLRPAPRPNERSSHVPDLTATEWAAVGAA